MEQGYYHAAAEQFIMHAWITANARCRPANPETITIVNTDCSTEFSPGICEIMTNKVRLQSSTESGSAATVEVKQQLCHAAKTTYRRMVRTP